MMISYGQNKPEPVATTELKPSTMQKRQTRKPGKGPGKRDRMIMQQDVQRTPGG